MRAVAVVICVALAACLAACKSAPPPATLPHPYKVVLLPVEGAAAALAGKPGASDVALAMTPEELSSKIGDRVRSSHVFSDVVSGGADDGRARPADEDPMQAASDLARRTASDLILRIVVKSARMTDLGNNSSTFWSTVTWFMAGFPSFWVDDRTYETDIAVQAELYDPADPVKPTASVVATSGKQDLDLWDRGLTPLVILVPPAFLKGSASSVSRTLTDRAVDQVLAALVEELRTREIPTRFQLDVVRAGADVNIAVESRRRLRSLAVEVDGKPAQLWAETGLVEDQGSAADRFVYRRTFPLAAVGATGGVKGTSIRVIAEDEAGGREVRTLVIGGSLP